MDVEDAVQSSAHIAARAEAMGGYVAGSSIGRSPEGRTEARVTVRVPADRFHLQASPEGRTDTGGGEARAPYLTAGGDIHSGRPASLFGRLGPCAPIGAAGGLRHGVPGPGLHAGMRPVDGRPATSQCRGGKAVLGQMGRSPPPHLIWFQPQEEVGRGRRKGPSAGTGRPGEDGAGQPGGRQGNEEERTWDH